MDAILKNIMVATASKSSGRPVNSTDYRLGPNSLLYCGLCNTPKETDITVFGKTSRVPCLCQCASEKIKQEEAERVLSARIEELKRAGISDGALRNCTFAQDDGTAPKMAMARKYVDNWERMLSENIGFLITGNVGTGKTFMAACIANALLEKCVPVLVTSFPRLLRQFEGFDKDKNRLLASLNDFKLLVIDDLGVERQSDFALEQVYTVIDERYKSGKPMIITTNIPLEELRNPADIRYSRIYDRILESCVPIQLEGPSRRKGLAGNKMKIARELFS